MTTATEQRYIVRLELRNREVAHWILDKQPLSIGRTSDNDIVIDNLAISRQHACIENSPEGMVIRDKGSVNGLEVDGKTCSEALIADGTQVKIGKYTLSFEAEAERHPAPAPAGPECYEATMQVNELPRLANPAFLVEQGSAGEVKYPIDSPMFMMGKSDAVDVRLDGLLVASFHVAIKVDEKEHTISHLAGRRKLRVNGETTSQCILRDDDTIEIAGRTFRFQVAL